jgi:hypothetical protein
VAEIKSDVKQTGDLEFVRQVLRHESLAMTLGTLISPSQKLAASSPLDNLRAGR